MDKEWFDFSESGDTEEEGKMAFESKPDMKTMFDQIMKGEKFQYEDAT